MDIEKDFEINKETWNTETDIHYKSKFYDKQAFAKVRNSLKRCENDALKDVKGKSLLHLQCHFEQDSLSWANNRAQITAVYISDKAIELAKL